MVLLHDGSDTLLERRGRRGLGHGAILTAFRTFDGSTGDRRCGTTAPGMFEGLPAGIERRFALREPCATELRRSRADGFRHLLRRGAALSQTPSQPVRRPRTRHEHRRDPRARYRCTISNRFYTAEGHPVRRTAALCANVKGDSFRYVFDRA